MADIILPGGFPIPQADHFSSGYLSSDDWRRFEGKAEKTYVDDSIPSGASGTFTTADSKTVTVVNGIITSIV
jgi:hypothetical protein